MMTWIDNIYQKFEDMIQEVEDTVLEDFQYLENQMSIVGESVKKFCSTAMEDLIPPSTTSTSAPLLPIDDHYVGISEKSLQCTKKLSGTNLDSCYYVKADNLKSGTKPHVESANIESNVGSNVNQHNKEMPASETAIEAFASVADYCNETEDASTDQKRGVEVFVESAEEKEETMSSFSSDIPEDAIGFSIKPMQQDDDSKLDQTCVLISKDELQLAPNATVNLKLDQTCVLISKDELQFAPNTTVSQKTSEKKWLQPFSLIKKSARRQEYEELAMLHGKNENGNDDCIENICPTLREHILEREWELL